MFCALCVCVCQDCEGDLGGCLEEAHAQLQGLEQDNHTQEQEEDPMVRRVWSSSHSK